MDRLIFEGRAADEEEAERLIVSGEVSLSPCHHHSAVGPMAGVISPSMAVYEIENRTHGNRAYSNLNEGYGKVLRYGAYSEEVQERLRWMHEVMAPVLAAAIESCSGLDIRALLAEALHMGDEGHNRNKAGSILYTKQLAPHIAKSAPDPATAAAVLQALGDNALSVPQPGDGRLQSHGRRRSRGRGEYDSHDNGAERDRIRHTRQRAGWALVHLALSAAGRTLLSWLQRGGRQPGYRRQHDYGDGRESARLQWRRRPPLSHS